jgi:hypothetical protein
MGSGTGAVPTATQLFHLRASVYEAQATQIRHHDYDLGRGDVLAGMRWLPTRASSPWARRAWIAGKVE